MELLTYNIISGVQHMIWDVYIFWNDRHNKSVGIYHHT